MSILLTGVSLFKWIRSFSTSARFNLSFLNGVHFIRLQVAFVFPTLPPFVFFKDSDFLIKYLFIHVKSLHSFPSCSYPVILMKILTELQVRHSSLVFFSGGFKSSFRCWSHIPFSSFQIPSHAGAPLYHSLLTIQLFRSAEDISEDSRLHSRSIQVISRLLSHSSHLIQPVQSLLQIVQRCIFWVGPNPQVFSQDLTWLFSFPGVTLKFFSKFDVRMICHQSNALVQDLSNSFHRRLNFSILHSGVPQ